MRRGTHIDTWEGRFFIPFPNIESEELHGKKISIYSEERTNKKAWKNARICSISLLNNLNEENLVIVNEKPNSFSS